MHQTLACLSVVRRSKQRGLSHHYLIAITTAHQACLSEEVIRCRGARICSPFVSLDPLDTTTIYYVSAGTGEVYAYRPQDNGSHTSIAFSGGEPYGAQFDRRGRLHIADAAHAAVLRTDDSDSPPGVLVRAYEERALRGPTSIAIGARDNDDTIFFTDSGPLGETTLEAPRGSVFSISASPSGGQVLRPLALACLAHPCGIATGPNDPTLVFVAEMMRNRVLRLCQRPSGAYHLSVFHQFAGGLGPSSIAVVRSSGQLIVGHFDFAASDVAKRGTISVLAPDGALQYTLHVPGTEITGVCLSADERFVIVTEASSNAMHRLALR